MKCLIAISNTRDPLNGRFTYCRKVHSAAVTVGTAQAQEARVDLVIQRETGPYIRVRMDLEAAQEISRDLQACIQRAMTGS